MLFDNYSTQAAQASLDALWLKTKVISNNLANASTPGFKASSVGFEQVLQEATARRSTGAAGDANQQSRRERSGGLASYSPAGPQGNNSGNYNQLSRSEIAAGGTGETMFRTRVAQNDDTEVRIDGNNVSLEKEQTELWKSYAQYSYLVDRLSGHYNNISNAITTMRG